MNELREEIAYKYIDNNYIQTALFEVTHRCPSDCIHCLLIKNQYNELSREEIFGLLDQLRDEGVLELGITGGEPFLRKDLPEILEYARKHRFATFLLTTGILIGKAEADMLRSLQIKQVEISLLGAKAETHDTIMKLPGAFERMIEAVGYLRKNSINVKLKTTVLKQNYNELHEMAELARSLDANYSANVSVIPKVDGDKFPQQYALNEEELEKIDFSLAEGGLVLKEDDTQGAVLTCLAGKTSVGISPQGDIFPCIVLRRKVGNIRNNSLGEIWHTNPVPFLNELRGMTVDDVSECNYCSLKSHCKRCPGFAYLETGDPKASSPIACIIAAAREKASLILNENSEKRFN